MELVLGEHPQEDVLGEDVLQQHLPDLGLRHGGADAAVTQLEEPGDALAVLLVALLGVGDRLAEVLEDGRQVRGELLPRLAELPDLRQLVVEEPADESVEPAGVGHVHPHRLIAVLEEHRDPGVFEQNVVAGIAAGELVLDFGIQVVVGVLGLPVAAGHAEGVADGAVGLGALGGGKLRDQDQLVAVGGAVGGQAVLEGRSDVQLVIRAASLDELGQGGVVVLCFQVGGHGCSTGHP